MQVFNNYISDMGLLTNIKFLQLNNVYITFFHKITYVGPEEKRIP